METYKSCNMVLEVPGSNLIKSFVKDKQTGFTPSHEYMIATIIRIRNQNLFHLIIPPTSTTTYMSSFCPRTIREWNSLPLSLIVLNSFVTFSELITNHLKRILYLLVLGLNQLCCLPPFQ